MRERLVAVLVAAFVGLVAVPVAFAQADDEALRGTLSGPGGDPVQGVTITVTRDGERVGSATTGQEGTWEVGLPGPGDYDVTLDAGTLPQGVVPREPDATTLDDVTVRPGEEQTVIFPLAAPQQAQGDQQGGAGPTPPPDTRAGDGFGLLGTVAERLVAGIKLGAIIGITSIGLSLIFGTTGLINFAHGELVTIGATLAFLLNAAALGPGLHVVPAALVAIAAVALFGAGLERGLWRPLRSAGTGRIQLLIISIGLSLVLRHVVLLFFGSRPKPYAQYVLQEALQFGPISITPRDLAVIGLSVATLVGVGVMLQTSRTGKAMRAVADNRDLAESSGIDVARVILVVWTLGAGLAALGGVLFGLTEIVAWDMGFTLLLLMFAGVILGGLGTAYGAMAGSFFVGIIAEMSTLYFPVELRNAWALGALVLVLLVRPQGIFGRVQRVG